MLDLGRKAYMRYLDKIYKQSDISWFTPVELFKAIGSSISLMHAHAHMHTHALIHASNQKLCCLVIMLEKELPYFCGGFKDIVPYLTKSSCRFSCLLSKLLKSFFIF